MSAPTKVKLFENMDMTRGTICRQGVHMYADEPGVYFMRNGIEVDSKHAKKVGFNVDDLRKERTKFLKLQKAINEIEAEFDDRKEEIEAEFADPTEGKKLDSELVTAYFKSGGHPRETKDYAMKHMGGTLWTVLDKRDGNKQRIESTEREDAIDWMLTHAEEEEGAPVVEQAND